MANDVSTQFFDKDTKRPPRSWFNWSYKNRFSADFGYLIPAGIWDVPADTHFELDFNAVLSSNPTLGPVLGTIRFRAEAFWVEKAAYSDVLRNNSQVPLDRNVSFPVTATSSGYVFSPPSSLVEFLQMYPSGWYSGFFNSSDPNTGTPGLNAIPLVMYYDIFRNYYYNPQDDAIPLRVASFIPDRIVVDDDGTEVTIEGSPAADNYISKKDLDDFVQGSRNSLTHVVGINTNYQNHFNTSLLPPYPNTSLNNGPDDLAKRRFTHYGLLRRTYHNDFFNSFITNENVDLMRNHSRVQVSANGNSYEFNMEQVSLANRNWRFATRSLLWGNSWSEYNKAHYGTNVLIPYGKPQFLGAVSSEVVFQDVQNLTQVGDNQTNTIQSNNNLGARAGIAFGRLTKGGKGNFVEFNSKEEGYVMVLLSIIPDVDYFQGIDPMYFKTNLRHSWSPEYNSVGMQDFMSSWMTAVPPKNMSDGNTESWQEFNVGVRKVPIWYEYMAKYNQLHGDFTELNYLRSWTFSRPFNNLSTLFAGNAEATESDFDLYDTTYVLPELHNFIFANNLGVDNFQIQVAWDCKASMMLDKQVIAYL